MQFFTDWRSLVDKEIEEKKVFFNQEMSRLFEWGNPTAIRRFSQPIVISGKDFRVDLQIREDDNYSHVDFHLFSEHGKVLYWGIYNFVKKAYEPKVDVLYLDYVFMNMNQVLPLIETAFQTLYYK